MLLHFVLAHAIPYLEGGTGWMQVVTGTGYILGYGRSEEVAWRESRKLLERMDGSQLRELLEASRTRQMLGYHDRVTA